MPGHTPHTITLGCPHSAVEWTDRESMVSPHAPTTQLVSTNQRPVFSNHQSPHFLAQLNPDRMPSSAQGNEDLPPHSLPPRAASGAITQRESEIVLSSAGFCIPGQLPKEPNVFPRRAARSTEHVLISWALVKLLNPAKTAETVIPISPLMFISSPHGQTDR